MANIAVTLPHREAYGAQELKENIRIHTIRGIIVSISALLIFLILYTILVNRDTTVLQPPIIPINRIMLEKLQSNDDTKELNAPQELQAMVNTGPAARAGNPVPAPDSEITPDMQDFAKVDEVARANAEGGNGVDLGGMSSDIDVGSKTTLSKAVEEIPAYTGKFEVFEENANVSDYGALQKSVVYPENAKRAGIEGKVIIAVYIDKYGKPRKTKILDSPNMLLEEPAITAVMKYTGYTPAIQNKQPVGCWLQIPINFKLR
jgi:TonB family protein